MLIRDSIGKTFLHDSLGKVEVMAVEEKSRTKVIVKVLDRGKGWNEEKQKYTGVRISTGWYRGENRQFGNVDVVHIKTLK